MRAIAEHFRTDEVVVVGSQAILVSRQGAPRAMRESPEIDAYPANARAWEREHGIEASEEINALFGYRSRFDETHGFYIDGVDEKTAMLPPDWRSRAAVRNENVGGRRVRVVAPGPEDLIVSKLARLEDKDREWIRAYRARYPWNRQTIRKGLASLPLPAAKLEAALGFVATLERSPRPTKRRYRAVER